MATDEATVFTDARDEVDECLKVGHAISLHEEVEKAINLLMTCHSHPLRRYNYAQIQQKESEGWQKDTA